MNNKSRRLRYWWWFLYSLCLCAFTACYRYRAWGGGHLPRRGPVLFVSNHQSYFDPIAVGLGCRPWQFRSMARSTLFDHWLFGWLIRSLGAIPVVQGGADKAAMRKCLAALDQGEALLIFPEGSRTLDGQTAEFAPGTMLLIKRSRAAVVPVAVEGAYDAWPRAADRPRARGRIHVRFGRPIDAQTLIDMGAQPALKMLRDRVETMRQDLAEQMADSKKPARRIECYSRAV